MAEKDDRVRWVLTFFMFLIDFITYSQKFYEELDEDYMMAHSQVHLQDKLDGENMVLSVSKC